eukprot:4884663-Amphidinium_carterae.1
MMIDCESSVDGVIPESKAKRTNIRKCESDRMFSCWWKDNLANPHAWEKPPNFKRSPTSVTSFGLFQDFLRLFFAH